MAFLQRVLKIQATLWAVFGVGFAMVPGWLDVSTESRPWVRPMGVMAVVLAMLMVLVAQHATELWWWAWTFALLDAGTATVTILDAAFGRDGGATWQPWVLGSVSATFGALVLVGISAAGRERPIVP
jgi:hypothetical protein